MRTFIVHTNHRVDGFTKEVGYVLNNIAIDIAPYDTGNLRRAIGLMSNTKKRIVVEYDAFEAYYLHYLEMGQGPIKKHKGFISERTMAAYILILADYFSRGEIRYEVQSKPTVNLQRSKHGAMFSEKILLREMKHQDYGVTADDRRRLSNIYFRSINESNKEISSLRNRAKTKRLYKLKENKEINLFYTDVGLF